MDEAAFIDEAWESLKRRGCADPPNAARVVMVGREIFANAVRDALTTVGDRELTERLSAVRDAVIEIQRKPLEMPPIAFETDEQSAEW